MIASVSAITRSSSTTRTLGLCLLLFSVINADSWYPGRARRRWSGGFRRSGHNFSVLDYSGSTGLPTESETVAQISRSLNVDGNIAGGEYADGDERKCRSFD